MPTVTHELKGVQELLHELLTYILGSVVVIAIFLAAFVGYLRWTKRRRNAKGPARKSALRPRSVRQQSRRRREIV